VFQNNRNKQKTNRNSSKFFNISTFLIPHTISSVCFGCFDTGPKYRNKPKQTQKIFLVSRKSKPKQIEFGFVSVRTEKKINSFEDPLLENVFLRFSVCFAKQTEKQLKQIEFRFVLVRTKKKLYCFEETLSGTLLLSHCGLFYVV
jgi:hypothetical protein